MYEKERTETREDAREIIVDNFAGGAGASTGIELAAGRIVDVAVNHDPDAILMHKTNHPHTTHYQASVWDVDPVEVCRGRPVGLAWFSPDCKHFSKAKGGKPVEKKIRGLAWIVLRWAGKVHPRVMILENVEEFQTWGPVRKGRPVRKLAGQTAHDPLHTITAKDREGVALASLSKYYGGVVGAEVSSPLPTVTAVDHNALQTVHLVKMKGTNLGGPVTDPVQTITAGGGHHGVVTTEITKASPGADLRSWPKIRAALNEFCGYQLADNEVILFLISGAWYFMADIGLRMLTPRELYRANGFPDDYRIERDYTGTVYGKTKQVARCANAVPPPFATALVRANLPEWCGQTITTMEELEKAVAV